MEQKCKLVCDIGHITKGRIIEATFGLDRHSHCSLLRILFVQSMVGLYNGFSIRYSLRDRSRQKKNALRLRFMIVLQYSVNII